MKKLFKQSLLAFAVLLISIGAAHAQALDYLGAGGAASVGDAPLGVSDCSGGEIHDDGVAENGYGWNEALVSDGIYADVFTPASDFSYTEVCFCWVQLGGDTTIDFQIEVWDNTGPGGAPGNNLGVMSAQATGVGGTLPGNWYSYDISSLNIDVANGDSVYIGARWDPTADLDFFICSDESPGTPLNGGHNWNDNAGAWSTTQSLFPGYRSLLLRANGEAAGGVGPARFEVSKNFDDDNEAEVEVTLSCNTGLPLEQTIGISEGDPVTFVVNDFEPGAMDCVVTEEVPVGYEAFYNFNDTGSDEGCVFEEVSAGFYQCEIDNSLLPVEIDVTKVWIDENPQFNGQNIAEAVWSCSNEAFCNVGFLGDECSGYLNFYGNPGSDSFLVYPDWENGTVCDVDEVFVADGGVEIDDSECQNLTVWPGVGAECTIYNTRLYEGIPTLSQYGLAVLALLMLGVGFIGFRRLV